MVSLSNHVAISMRLNTRRRTVVTTATGLPRYARNDKVGTRDPAGSTVVVALIGASLL